MVRTLILYESKYGFTEKISKSLSLILGPAKYCRTSDFNDDNSGFEVIVICTPIYMEEVDNNLFKYVCKNAEWIKQKKVFLICTCLAQNLAEQYLKPLTNILGESVVFQSSIGGELIINKLSISDYEMMKQFYNKIGAPFIDSKLFNKDKFEKLALTIKKIKDVGDKIIEEPMLKFYIENFIKNHNTCALASGHGECVRATPIEYVSMGECLYILSEGGEKFSNILQNPNVSVCIYDEYKNMNELAGMQIKGTAELIDIGSEEYISLLTHKGLKYEKIMKLPIALNLIKINIKTIEFLWSGFAKLGYDTKQILNIQK